MEIVLVVVEAKLCAAGARKREGLFLNNGVYQQLKGFNVQFACFGGFCG